MVKTVALVDPYWSGHHPTYFKIFCKIALSNGYRVLAFCPNPAEMYEWVKTFNQREADFFQAYLLETPVNSSNGALGRIMSALGNWQLAAQTIRTAVKKGGPSPNLVFFCWLDSYLVPLLNPIIVDRVFGYPWSGLYFHPRHLRIKSFSLIKRLGLVDNDTILKAFQCHSVAVLDEGISCSLSKKIKEKKVIVLPDVADESVPDPQDELVKEIVARANGRKIVSLLGSLEKRKGILTVLEVAKSKSLDDWFFIFAGKLTEQCFSNEELNTIKAIIKEYPDNCLFSFNSLKDETQFNSVINASDALFVIYENFPHSSNLLTKAALFDKPVIATEKYCIGERVKSFGLGITIAEGDTMQCINSLKQLGEEIGRKSGNARRFREYRKEHSMHQMVVKFTELLNT